MAIKHKAPTSHKSNHSRLESVIETVFERGEGLDQSFPKKQGTSIVSRAWQAYTGTQVCRGAVLTEPVGGGYPCRWQVTIDAHPLESHNPDEWLDYGIALLQTINPGPKATKQLQQAGLTFVQARNHGASEVSGAAAQQYSVIQSLCNALDLVSIDVPVQPACVASMPGTFQCSPDLGRTEGPQCVDPFRDALMAMAKSFKLELPADASVLDQLLIAKTQLRQHKVAANQIRLALQASIAKGTDNSGELLQKFLLFIL
jgi:hypothetical protein